MMKSGKIIFTITADSLSKAKNQVYEQFGNDDEITVFGEWNKEQT